jgi:hypothetical protein
LFYLLDTLVKIIAAIVVKIASDYLLAKIKNRKRDMEGKRRYIDRYYKCRKLPLDAAPREAAERQNVDNELLKPLNRTSLAILVTIAEGVNIALKDIEARTKANPGSILVHLKLLLALDLIRTMKNEAGLAVFSLNSNKIGAKEIAAAVGRSRPGR